MEHICNIIVRLIIEGSYTFKKVAKKFKAKVRKKLKEKGREDLATESEAIKKE